MALSTLTACTDRADPLLLLNRLEALDDRARAAQVVALAIDLPAPPATRDLETDLRRLGDAAPGTLWIANADPDALATVAAGGASRTPPILVVATAPFPPPASPLSAPATPDPALGGALAAEAASLGVGIVVLPLPLPPPGSPAPLPDIDALAARLEMLVRGAVADGLAVAVALEPTPAVGLTPAVHPARARLLEEPLVRAATRAGAAAVVLPASRLLSSDHEVAAALRRDFGDRLLVVADLRGVPADSLDGRAIQALDAGADLLITPDRGLPARLAAAVDEGVLSPARVADAATRVLGLKLAAPHSAPVTRAAARGVGASGVPAIASGSSGASRAPTPEFGATLRRGTAGEAGMSGDGLSAVGGVMRAGLADSVFTAAAVAVGRAGRLVLLEGYGELPDGTPVSGETTLFDLASLSKVVGTTTAVGILIDQGRLDLDVPIARYLPEYVGDGKEDVTLRHLLSHTSGLPSGLWLYGSADSRGEALRQVIRQPLRGAPGEAVEYSDLGMLLVAAVVERVAGMPLDAFLARHLFLPLDLSSTMYLPPADERGRIAPTLGDNERPYPLQGVVHDANAFRFGGVAGHAGLFSTARDLAVFAQMVLNGGAYGPVEILADSTVAELTRRQPGADERALGWDTPADRSSAGRFFSAESFGHTGYTGTSLWIDPARDLFVVLLTNRTLTEASADEILDLRIDVHEAVARAIADEPVTRRPGSR